MIEITCYLVAAITRFDLGLVHYPNKPALDLISLSARGKFIIQGMISECCLRCRVGTPIY
jgi:hypothetical protein